MEAELIRYRFCGYVFLVMNLLLSSIVFFMIYYNRTFHHHQITAIAMAAYTFTALVVAIIGVVRYRRYNSPVYSASKASSLAAASVSMLTLSSTLLTAFDEGGMTEWEIKLLLLLVGVLVFAFIIAMAIYMIVRSRGWLREIKSME